MFRPLKVYALAAAWAACGALAHGQAAATPTPTLQPQEKKAERSQARASDANLTPEAIAETVIIIHGGRPVLEQVRRTAVERGRVVREVDDGPDVEITYERLFKRGETSDKDMIRINQKRSNLEYSIIYNEGRVWGVIRGTAFKPRQEELTDLDSYRLHGIETLLRYKENGATLNFVGKDKQKGIDLWILDLTDKQSRRTRYFISSQTGKVLWLEYEATPEGAAAPVKYRKTFHDYRIVQNTRTPYRVVLYAGDRKLQETQVMTVTFGVKMEDSLFKEEAAAGSN